MSLGKVLGVIAGLLPLIYIGWLLRHFIGVGGGTAEGVATIGLGPTVIGLSLVGLVLLLPIIIKLLRGMTGVNRVPGKSFDAESQPDEPSFDADAALANYMRKRELSGSAPPNEAGSFGAAEDDGHGPVRSLGFGRKGIG
ncbi:MAG: hypothetical protein Q7T68_15010 [Sphingopyxis sp.]|nr:hypothetical protein [Sphingopyxis sp.]